MFTQCGQCRTTHRVNAKSLAQAYGRVRCMHCGAVFNALDALADSLGKDGRFPPQFHSEQPAPLDGQEHHFRQISQSVGTKLSTSNDADSKSRSSMFWVFGIVLLGLCLLAQFAYFERQALSQHALLQPAYEHWCQWVGCQLEPPRAIEQLALVNRDVRPHPDLPGALLISATVQNRAGFAQPYPQIGVTLRDFDNGIVAERYFHPGEYIEADRWSEQGLAADTLLPVEFEVVDPSRDAVAFEFSFR